MQDAVQCICVDLYYETKICYSSCNCWQTALSLSRPAVERDSTLTDLQIPAGDRLYRSSSDLDKDRHLNRDVVVRRFLRRTDVGFLVAHKRARILDRRLQRRSTKGAVKDLTNNFVRQHTLSNKSSYKNILATQLELPLSVVKRLIAPPNHALVVSPGDTFVIPAYSIVNCDAKLLASIVQHLQTHSPSGIDKLARIVDGWRTLSGLTDGYCTKAPDSDRMQFSMRSQLDRSRSVTFPINYM